MGDLVQQVFNEISLERDPAIWQSSRQDAAMTEKRINFLAEFQETLFSKEFDLKKSPSRKNDGLADALMMKSDKSKDGNEKLRFLTQALLFATEHTTDSLLRRRAQVHREVGAAPCALQDLITITNKTTEDKENIATIAAEMDFKGFDLTGDCDELIKIVGDIVNNKTNWKDMEFSKHKNLRNFSNKISIRKEKGRGRFLVAEEDISPGEIIARETSYSAVLDRPYVGTNCTHCLRRLTYCLPCPRCSLAKFCSASCRAAALASHHRHECGLQDTVLYRGGCEAWLLALRIVGSKPLAEWRRLRGRMGTHDESLGMAEDDLYESEDIMTVYNLVTHDTEADRAPPLLMKECLTAVFFLRVLQVSGYFGPGAASEPRAGRLTPEEMFLAKLLHHFMRVVFYNSHEVTELQPGPASWPSNKVAKVGVAINPSLALINHSCDPNYARVEAGTAVLGCATRLIRAGEEILDVYSGTFVTAAAESRAEVHARYNFQCGCAACSLGWPTHGLLPRNVKKTHLINKNISENDAKKIDKMYKQVTNADWQKKTPCADVRLEVSKLLSTKQLMHPHFLKYQTEDILHKCLWDTYGRT